MAGALAHVTNNLNKLKSLVELNNPANLEARDQILSKLKIAVLQFKSLPPCQGKPDPKECVLAREVFEYAAFQAIEKEEVEQFQGYVNLLKFYYEEFGDLPKSEKKYPLLGLYLLSLLAQNKISNYHMELELLSNEDRKNVYIETPLSLEQHFVDGNYGKILSTKQNVPLKSYNFFIDQFSEAVRFEVARSAEKAYDSLKVEDACSLLMLQNEGKLREFIENDAQAALEQEKEWIIEGGRLNFKTLNEDKLHIPAVRVIEENLHFATEFERIV